MDNFTKIPFSTDNLDRYYIRSSILNSIRATLPYFKGRLLDIGCGQMPYKEYITDRSEITQYVGIDLYDALEYNKNIEPDYRWDGNVLPFLNSEFETVIMVEVLEHIPNPASVLMEVNRVLDNGGYLFFTVPFLWPLHEVPNDEYRYTPFSIQKILNAAGFSDIEIYATGGWNASLAQMLGLWVRRSEISSLKKKCLSILLLPLIKYLIYKDKKSVCFKESQMITGLYGTARKE